MQLLQEVGKTAVLVERIIQKIIYDKVDIDKILVVTFTSSAASEMRERILDAIYKKLEENPEDENLQKQIILLNKASICTIDSFCLDVIRNNFFEIDISANARVADGTEILLLKQEILDDLFEEKYIENDENFIELIDTYTHYNKDEELKDLILKLYTYIQASPFPEDWLKDSVKLLDIDKNENFSNTPWGKIIVEKVNETLENGVLKLKNIKHKIDLFPELDKYSNMLNMDIANLLDIKVNLENWDIASEKLSSLSFKPWPSDKKIINECKDEAKEIRDSVKEDIKKIKGLMNTSSEEANADIIYMHRILKNLNDITIEFSNRFYNAKRERNIMDFNDMEHLALQILIKKDETGNIQKTDVAKKYSEKFEEIAIDEYQDSNLVQEYILTSISKDNNIFMVGDVKQSIYKFRQARPQLFLEKYNTYSLEPQNDENRKIKLFKNFRSRENILSFTNLVFENLMSEELGEINYNTEEYLNLGANYPKIEQNLKTECYIIDTKEEDNIWKNEEKESEAEEDQEEIPENVVLEARFVAKKIKELVENKYQVSCKNQGTRDIEYRDIAILLRSTSDTAGIYEKEISELGIPVYSESSGEYLQSTEIETIMALLKIINNPMQDIPLVTVMRSPIANFTDNELIEIRLKDRNGSFYEAVLKSTENSKVEKFLNLLDELRNDEEYMTLDEWIWNIYTKTGYMDYVSLMPNGAIRIQNLKMLFERAKQYESASFKGLFNFINFIDKIKFNSEDLNSAKLIGENENVVRIMTIHKSKGLEFPVVIVGGFGKQFNFKDLSASLLLDQDLGIGPQYINNQMRIEFPTLAKKALGLKAKDEAISEEMRILYVALTRAKEKLIIVGRQKDANKKIMEKSKLLEIYQNSEKISPYVIGKYKTYLDWLELIYAKVGANDIFSLEIINKSKLIEKSEIEAEEKENFVDKIKNKEIGKYSKEISDIINWQYNYRKTTDIPTKTSVTKIKEMKNVLEIEEKTKKAKFEQEESEKLLTLSPKFLNENKDAKISSSRKGTLMHLCIQNMNEKEVYDTTKINALIESLRNKELITDSEKNAININKLLNYTKTNLWKELSDAKEIHKEQPFYINIKASELYDDIESKDDENILVQGVIDLYFIDGNNRLILVDYKTDYVEEGKELIEKYKSQLEIYRKALEQALGRNVYKTQIYSLYLNKCIEL